MWEAFAVLARARTQGTSSYNPLAVSEIMGLICTGGIAYFGDKPKYLRLIQRLDETFLEHQAEKAPKT